MRKDISVYTHSLNPAIDLPVFRVSRYDAQYRVDVLSAHWVRPNAIQLRPPPGWIAPDHHTGLFAEVWRPRPSAHYIVWQMNTQNQTLAHSIVRMNSRRIDSPN